MIKNEMLKKNILDRAKRLRETIMQSEGSKIYDKR